MFTENVRPGKFEGNRSQLMAEVVHCASLDGCDDQVGSVQDEGFYGLILGKRYAWIIMEDNYGFVDVDTYQDKNEAIKRFEAIAQGKL